MHTAVVQYYGLQEDAPETKTVDIKCLRAAEYVPTTIATEHVQNACIYHQVLYAKEERYPFGIPAKSASTYVDAYLRHNDKKNLEIARIIHDLKPCNVHFPWLHSDVYVAACMQINTEVWWLDYDHLYGAHFDKVINAFRSLHSVIEMYGGVEKHALSGLARHELDSAHLTF